MGLSGVRKRRCSTGVTLSGSRAVLRATDALSLKRRRRRSLLSLQEPQEEDPRGGRLNGWGPDDGLNRATRGRPSETSRGSTRARSRIKIELSPGTPKRGLKRRIPEEGALTAGALRKASTGQPGGVLQRPHRGRRRRRCRRRRRLAKPSGASRGGSQEGQDPRRAGRPFSKLSSQGPLEEESRREAP